MSNKKAENVVMILRGSEVVARFTAHVEDDVTKTAKRQATMFLKEILESEEHELHEDLMEGRLERVNAHPELLAPKMSLTL